MKKGDIIIVFSVILAAVICFLGFAVFGEKGSKVTISQNNTVIYEGTVMQEKTVELETNTVEINNGKIKMVHANCKNQVCVNHKEISKKGESIICLPNKVMVEIE